MLGRVDPATTGNVRLNLNQTVYHLIRLARARRPYPDLLLEERLFRLLISIYRSTEAMGLWTAAAAAGIGDSAAELPKKVD